MKKVNKAPSPFLVSRACGAWSGTVGTAPRSGCSDCSGPGCAETWVSRAPAADEPGSTPTWTSPWRPSAPSAPAAAASAASAASGGPCLSSTGEPASDTTSGSASAGVAADRARTDGGVPRPRPRVAEVGGAGCVGVVGGVGAAGLRGRGRGRGCGLGAGEGGVAAGGVAAGDMGLVGEDEGEGEGGGGGESVGRSCRLATLRGSTRTPSATGDAIGTRGAARGATAGVVGGVGVSSDSWTDCSEGVGVGQLLLAAEAAEGGGKAVAVLQAGSVLDLVSRAPGLWGAASAGDSGPAAGAPVGIVLCRSSDCVLRKASGPADAGRTEGCAGFGAWAGCAGGGGGGAFFFR